MPEPVDDDVVAEAGLEEAVPSLSA
jgi:hypothetical protein